MTVVAMKTSARGQPGSWFVDISSQPVISGISSVALSIWITLIQFRERLAQDNWPLRRFHRL